MLEKTLSTGEKLRILRFVTPEEIPERIIRYWIASLRFDTYRLYVSSISYWRLYFREVQKDPSWKFRSCLHRTRIPETRFDGRTAENLS